ncbi:MAG: hypothetical protein JXA37_11135 [Chloroflexia bacterium]|nr:hypothetical protein [Chloroflexia bacterium]
MANPERRLRRTTRFYLSKVNRAISRYNLIDEGDRIIVAVSGGKDSLALLRLLKARQKFHPLPFEMIAVHVTYKGWDVGAPPPEFLARYFEQEGVSYNIEEADFTQEQDLDCFRCSWLRRKVLFETAYRLGCNKVALAHNQQDIVETALINLLLHGRLERPEPRTPLFGGEIILIRPLVLLTAKELRRFARVCELPVHETTCPHAESGMRAEVGDWLRQLKRSVPTVYVNVYRATERYAPRQKKVPRGDRGRTLRRKKAPTD